MPALFGIWSFVSANWRAVLLASAAAACFWLGYTTHAKFVAADTVRVLRAEIARLERQTTEAAAAAAKAREYAEVQDSRLADTLARLRTIEKEATGATENPLDNCRVGTDALRLLNDSIRQ